MILSGEPYRDRVFDAVQAAGLAFHPRPERAGERWVLPGRRPAAVVIDGNTDKRFTALAGYYRGSGVPGVYLTPDKGRMWPGYPEYMMSALGFKLVRVADFAGWIASNPPYLSAGPYVPRDDAAEEPIPGSAEPCPECGQPSDAVDSVRWECPRCLTTFTPAGGK